MKSTYNQAVEINAEVANFYAPSLSRYKIVQNCSKKKDGIFQKNGLGTHITVMIVNPFQQSF